MSRWKADLPSEASDWPPMNQASAAMYCTVIAITGNCLPSTLWVSSATASTVLRVSWASGSPERWTTMWGILDSMNGWLTGSLWAFSIHRKSGKI